LSQTDQNVSNEHADKSKIPLSREDEASIHSLAQELRAPLNLVAELYGRELARLRPSARVTTFLPLLVSRLVRRSHVEVGRAA
jgi:hypothetical protein